MNEYKIDVAWYVSQRAKLSVPQQQIRRANVSLARCWYKIITRSLRDLPIHQGGRSVLAPEYGLHLDQIATALGLSPRTLSNYRTAVSRITDEAHFEQLIEGRSWASLVFDLGASAGRRATDGRPKRRLTVAIPVKAVDYLMDEGLDARDVTAIIVAFLKQERVQKDLLQLFQHAKEQHNGAVEE